MSVRIGTIDLGTIYKNKVDPEITINQKPHQQISVKLEKVYDPEIYTSTFKLQPAILKTKAHLYVRPTDAGYAHGQLSWTPNTFVNGSYIDYDLTINVTDATPIQNVVIPTGYDDYYIHNSRDNFYEDTNYDIYKTKSELSGNIILFDLDNYYVRNAYMPSMFQSCTELTAVDLSNINTVNATNLGSMFNGCSKLRSVNLSNLDTTKNINLGSMFQSCSSLESVDLSNFDTTNVESLSYMFKNCSSLNSVDLSNFNTTKVTQMSRMFEYCAAQTINVTSFNTSNATNLSYMFNGCYKLTSLDVSNLDTANNTDFTDMFRGCSNLIALDVSNFDTSKDTSGMHNMFYNSTKLEYLIIGSSVFKFQLKNNTSLPNTCKILVPQALISTYQNATNWSVHASKFDAIENYNITRANGQITVTPKNA